jgi:hypothetical protein
VTTTAHLDYDVLADLAEGLLDDAKAISAQEHLAGCDECRDRAAELSEVSRVLAEAPVPPMPAHLVDRLDAALAAEAAARITTRRSARRFQLVAAAAAAVVVAGGGVAVAHGMLRGAGSSGNASDASQPGARALNGPSGANLQRPKFAGPDATPRSYRVVSSGTKYTAATLAHQVAHAISGYGVKEPLQAPEQSGAGQSVDECVSGVARGLQPLLVDQSSYDGSPATIIVLPARTKGQVAVWIVDSGCVLVRQAQVPR